MRGPQNSYNTSKDILTSVKRVYCVKSGIHINLPFNYFLFEYRKYRYIYKKQFQHYLNDQYTTILCPKIACARSVLCQNFILLEHHTPELHCVRTVLCPNCIMPEYYICPILHCAQELHCAQIACACSRLLVPENCMCSRIACARTNSNQVNKCQQMPNYIYAFFTHYLCS